MKKLERVSVTYKLHADFLQMHIKIDSGKLTKSIAFSKFFCNISPN